MILRAATERDKEAVLGLYKAAQQFMAEMGIDQWQDGYPNEATFSVDLAQGVSIVAEEEGEIIATAAAYMGNEPTYEKIFEGEWLTDRHTYGMIHRIAVAPEHKKGGIASAIFRYVDELCREQNLPSARCDTHRDNLPMQRTLKKNGYQYCGIIYLESGDERLAFEKVY